MSDEPMEPLYNRVILASAHKVDFNSKAAPFKPDEKSLWYLVDENQDTYALYKETSLLDTMRLKDGRELARFDSDSYPVGVFHKEEYRWSCKDDRITIEYVPLELILCNLRHNGMTGIEDFIEHLPDRAEKFTDNQLQALIYEVEAIEDEVHSIGYGIETRLVTTPEQKHWTRRIYAILVREMEARKLLVRLQDHGIIRLERRP